MVPQDDIPEASETFFVNLTEVELVGPGADNSARPSIRIPGNVVQITILENDNARGTVQFDVKTVSHFPILVLSCQGERGVGVGRAPLGLTSKRSATFLLVLSCQGEREGGGGHHWI